MTSKLKDNIINTKLQKAEAISAHSNSKLENYSKLDSSLRKLYLPSIQKKSISTIQDTSIRKLKKSQSQAIILNNYKNPFSSNEGKERILLAKSSLSRINAKINDLTLNFKKLLMEKEENLNIIKKALCSDDPTYSDQILLKIEQFLEDTIKTLKTNNKKTISTINYENMKNNEDKYSKLDESKEKINKTINKDENEQNINNNEEYKNNENNDNNQNNDNIQENQQNHNYSLETRAEDPSKLNIINNSHLLNNNNSSLNNINVFNNSIEEQIKCIKEIIEEKDEDKGGRLGEKTLQLESGIFEKSSVPTKVFNVLKVKSELSFLKHKLINIEQKIRLKEEEIEELKSKAKMKNILFQKNILDSKMITLQQIQSKNKEIEEITLPSKNLMIENLRKNLKHYNEINKSYLVGNKDVEENYMKKKNEYDEKSRKYTNLEAKNSILKYKYNSLRIHDIKKDINLQNIKAKINMIDEIKQIIESHKGAIEEKKEEVEYMKHLLNEKIDKHNKTKEEKENKYQEMNKMQREFNQQLSRKKNEANKIKKETKEIDALINKEIQIFNNLNKKDKNLVAELLLYKNKASSEFLKYLEELEIYENKRFIEQKKNRFKKLKKGNKITHDIISKIKKNKNIKEEAKSTEDEKLLEEKLVYYLNSKGEKESQNNEIDDKNKESDEKQNTNEKNEVKGKKEKEVKKKK